MSTPELPSLPFPDRLALARRLVAEVSGSPTLPVHLADQLQAAVRDAAALLERAAALLPLVDPERNWRLLRGEPTAERLAYLLAGVLGSLGAVCPHLRSGAVQPAVVWLAQRRVDCHGCTRTVRRPPPDEGDRCDLCGRRGVERFTPFLASRGPLTVLGDLCDGCAAALGLLGELAPDGAGIDRHDDEEEEP